MMHHEPADERQAAAGQGILLLYTGSPNAADPVSVRAYLRRFLMDPFVLDMPTPLRWLLVNGIIAPLRAGKSAAKYASIWMPEGSPLMVHTLHFKTALQQQMPTYAIGAAAAYGKPTLSEAVDAMRSLGVKQLLVAPLFPHYAAATTGSLLAMLQETLSQRSMPFAEVRVLPPFYNSPAYLHAVRAEALPQLNAFDPEYVIFSYHGLPLRQAHRPFAEADGLNYEEQCRRATELLVRELQLDPHSCIQAYQSRFGRKWLGPTLEATLLQLAAAGCRRVAVLAPSFVADCLETLEELDIEARQLFLQAGGSDYLRIPALNDAPVWVDAFAHMAREFAGNASLSHSTQ